jgi:catechol 2,3-dioxygenase-like lactoylglutathione lyase family enzyme
MTGPAQLDCILAFRLSTSDPERLRRFYIDAIGCLAAEPCAIPQAEMARLGVAGMGERTTLSLGEQRIDLDRFSQLGRPYPVGADAADLIFQHFAIVVTNAEAAYQRALKHGATAISTGGAIKLPAAQSGVIAVKFRDPDGHPLEFLQFPPDGPAAWARKALGRSGALGVDHSAISVANADASARFYEAHGLRLGHRTLNQGETQAALDGLSAPCVDVIPMLPATPAPHLELLGYRTPRAKPALASRPGDIAATRIVWTSDRTALLRDPDGHLHELEPQP